MLTNLLLVSLVAGSIVPCGPEGELPVHRLALTPPVVSPFDLLRPIEPSPPVEPSSPIVPFRPDEKSPPVAEEDRVIDLAICLDTSGSMQGLINAARDKLWLIVNDLATATPTPRLRIALLSYGNDGLSAENGWVSVVVPFTEDLDLLSERLFALTTNGGTEFVGRVVDAATDQLQWTKSERALKLIFVAGNESADQDQTIRYADACAKSIANGIQVNAVYCGPGTDGIAPSWREVAALADGHFAAIDHNKAVVEIKTPMDEPMATLSAAINATTLPYGDRAAWGASNQKRQDANARGCGISSAASRAITKCQSFYQNDWDLVDAVRNDKVKLSEIEAKHLPEALRGKSAAEIRKNIDETYAQRKKLQADILDLQKKREAFIAAERKKLSIDTTDQFDTAVRTAIRAQAAAKGFQFADEKALVGVEAGKEAAPKAEDQ